MEVDGSRWEIDGSRWEIDGSRWELVAEINARIDEYNALLAREKGWRNRKNNEPEAEEGN
jgi:hypothetical protein